VLDALAVVTVDAVLVVSGTPGSSSTGESDMLKPLL